MRAFHDQPGCDTRPRKEELAMTLPDLHVVAAILVALTPAVAIGWAIGAALDRHVNATGPTARMTAGKAPW